MTSANLCNLGAEDKTEKKTRVSAILGRKNFSNYLVFIIPPK